MSLIVPEKGVRSSWLSRFFTISAIPKQPNAILINPMPSIKNGRFMVKRICPLFTSVPISPSKTPIRVIAKPLSMLPVVTKLTQKNPNNISAQ